ncbi:TylF/MycF/NovP-related O-methyltransferase [Flavobacterium faecale]|uniref:TylF/MycF/NovP-related O-methyltransferase n=1 Tax=Flavobacterium faecale TaxID=1355330 RepID=UPI003AB09F14
MKYRNDFLQQTVDFYKNNISTIRSFKLSNNEENISHQNIVPYSTYSPWYDDKQFLETYEISKNNTLVDIYRCYELWNYVKKNNHLKGDILEVGVWKGGSGCILAKASELFSDGKVYLADTFKGVVKASEMDPVYKGGEHSDTNIQIVKLLVKELALKNTQILEGVFPDEINFELLNLNNVALKICHIDVDTYSSAKDIFFNIWPIIVKGGVVIFDDYGFWGCEGITKLVNELKLDNSVFIHNINGHGIFVKI